MNWVEEKRNDFYDGSIAFLKNALKRREETIKWTIGGHAGIFVVVGVDLGMFSEPIWILKIIMTLSIIGVGLMALARAQFEWGKTLMERHRKKYNNIRELRDFFEGEEKKKFDPGRAELKYRASIYIIIINGVLLLVTIWI